MPPLKNIVYFGTAPIAVPTMEALANHPGFKLRGVCTQPDRPAGRKRVLTPSPVKHRAMELGLPVFTPEKVGTAAEDLMGLDPDIFVVFAYGQYIPRKVFDAPPLGSINLHPSLLPAYRGASPIQSALADGLGETGLSIIRVGEVMDAGDVLLQRGVPIAPEDNAATLTETFARLGGEMILEALFSLRDGPAVWTPQDPAAVTECHKLQKTDGAVDWRLPARVLHNHARAYILWPGLYFPLDDKGANLKIIETRVESASGRPGEVLDTGKAGPLVACGSGALRLTRVQPPGKQPMGGGDFLNGHALPPGTILRNAAHA